MIRKTVKFEKLCVRCGGFSKCGELIEEVIEGEIELVIDEEEIKRLYEDRNSKPLELPFQCSLGRGIIEKEKEKVDTTIRLHDCHVLRGLINILKEERINKNKSKKRRGKTKEPDIWLSVNEEPCLIEIKVDRDLNSLIFGYQGGSEDNKDIIQKLLVSAKKPNDTVSIQKKLREEIKKAMEKGGCKECEFKLGRGKKRAINGSIYDIFKWIRFIDKIKTTLSLAFFLDIEKSLYECLDKNECFQKFLDLTLNALEEWKDVLNRRLKISYDYSLKMAIYKGIIQEVPLPKDEKNIPLILFMTETRYEPNNQPSNQTQGGSV